ncbi:hypothetical protein PC116_g9800 [Phytophthora cactorum]|nr:hypothetical protein PC116_g9800 [Phytophthora cactorum]
MAKTRAIKKKQKVARSRWTDLAAETSFPVTALEELEEHHKILNTFCADVYSPVTRADSEDGSGASIELSFHQYCVALNLYHAYAATNERGIDRQELFRLLQDHSERATDIVMKDDKLLHVTDPRHFDKLYTWLKKHFVVYDDARCGYLPENAALALLQTHPTALAHLKFQLVQFIKKVKENNARYADQAAAAQLLD